MIRIKDLVIKNNKNTLINDLTVDFKKGEFWAILGKNGVGKTTLLHNLAGFKQQQSGSIEVNESELYKLSNLIRAQKISLLPQLLEAGLNCTVEQAISYGRYPWHKDNNAERENKTYIEFAIKSMQIDTILQDNIQQLSGGELRKVEIATVLAQNSEIMLLDEPLNHLDVSFRFKLMQLLKQLSENKIIIMITHDIQYVKQYCTNVIMLLDNQETLIGKKIEIMTDENITRMLGIKMPEWTSTKTI